MKIICMADSHNRHNQIQIPACDILIHAGDATGRGRISEVEAFAKWFEKQPAKYKIFVPGNHEYDFEKTLPQSRTWFTDNCPSGILLIEESITIEGIKIFGSPWSLHFHSWAFNGLAGDDIQSHWDKIPNDADIVITHGPVHGIMDYCKDGHVGCPQLYRKLEEVKPKYHIHGHIHNEHGVLHGANCIHVNAAICDDFYNPVHSHIEIIY